MFKSLLASLGVGAARIDLILFGDCVNMGDEIKGKIVLMGGDVEQVIEGLYVDFNLESRYTDHDTVRKVHEVIQRIPIFKDEFTIEPKQTEEFPFSFTCPLDLPVSSVSTRYYFQTNLEIKQGIDSKDRDYVEVYPVGLLDNFMRGFHRLGLIHYAEGYTGRGGKQIIQFQPTDWLSGEFDEIVFDYQPSYTVNGIGGFYELDKKTSGVMGALADHLDLDEAKGRYHFSPQQLATPEKAEQTIRQFIMTYAKGLIGK
ncbi:sporulation-control protein [Seinonella peptonophila]|uniref:Sporulation-control protein n=1 Tax=Seinonella peptonophila TaxID=112248 RepID=A0A1M4Z439_9BACL|nr:sporulation protein [Seinonella peptonophila]SHF12780.1 sporulation-control protein [Seinonella peptonophila]